MQPINIIKLYFGEKYAFEYAFLIHYQSWLCIPSLFGLILYFYQLDRYRRLDIDMKTAFDSPMNGIFGLFVAIWATLFVESWKRKQKTIAHLWGVQDNSFSKVDERTDTYKSYNFYNEKTDRIEKYPLEVTKTRKFGVSIWKLSFLIVVIYSMIKYQILILGTKGKIDLETGDVIEPPTQV